MLRNYEPEVNDYVIWKTELGQVHEGWIYFKGEPPVHKRGWKKPENYVTIEIGIKEKPECEYDKNNPHKYIHILLCCYENQWHELQYVKRRKSRYDNTLVLEM
tara:strand:- start:480 stop:788 length:309 start_codon:yes stop_codon:yes gene_type:complete